MLSDGNGVDAVLGGFPPENSRRPAKIPAEVLTMKSFFRFITLTALLAGPALAADKLTTCEARPHIGETATVCGTVTSGRYAERTRGKPTFLDIDKRYPDNPFMVLIWGEDRDKIGPPEKDLVDKRICVSGRIQQYHGKPEIIGTAPTQTEQQ